MNSFNITFNAAPKVVITGDIDKHYLVELYEFRNGNKELITDFYMRTNHFHTYHREWWGDFKFEIYEWNEKDGLTLSHEHRYNDENKKVLINLDTDLLLESLIWFNKCIEYKDIHKCDLTVKTKFVSELQDIDKGVKVVSDNVNYDDYYSVYHVGKYDTDMAWNRNMTGMLYPFILTKNRTFCSYRNPRRWQKLSLDDVAGDILGLNEID